MCGIVGAIAQRNVTDILIEGLRRLEYRGYDSAGAAVLDRDSQIKRTRALGKVIELENKLVNVLLCLSGCRHHRSRATE